MTDPGFTKPRRRRCPICILLLGLAIWVIIIIMGLCIR